MDTSAGNQKCKLCGLALPAGEVHVHDACANYENSLADRSGSVTIERLAKPTRVSHAPAHPASQSVYMGYGDQKLSDGSYVASAPSSSGE